MEQLNSKEALSSAGPGQNTKGGGSVVEHWQLLLIMQRTVASAISSWRAWRGNVCERCCKGIYCEATSSADGEEALSTEFEMQWFSTGSEPLSTDGSHVASVVLSHSVALETMKGLGPVIREGFAKPKWNIPTFDDILFKLSRFHKQLWRNHNETGFRSRFTTCILYWYVSE